jgi:hypothetical protein
MKGGREGEKGQEREEQERRREGGKKGMRINWGKKGREKIA